MIQIEIGDAVPAGGEVEFLRAGAPIAHVVRHPRIPDYWLAMIKSRDLSLKKFKTRAGAVRFALRSTLSSDQCGGGV